jgi:hypothetical protein
MFKSVIPSSNGSSSSPATLTKKLSGSTSRVTRKELRVIIRSDFRGETFAFGRLFSHNFQSFSFVID